MTTSLLTFAPSSATAPDFTAFPFDHDFVLDGRPQSFCRNADGSLIIARGAEVMTNYGIGYVERRHVDGSYIVRITEFDEALEVPVYANPVEVGAFGVIKGYNTAQEQVAILSNCYNRRILERVEFFENHMKDVAHAEELLGLLVDVDAYSTSITGGDYCGATEFIYKTATNPMYAKKSSAETRAYQARIKAMADAMLNDADDTEAMPEGMADELAEVYGD